MTQEYLTYIPPDLLTAIKNAGYSPKSFSKHLGYSESWLYNLFQGKSRLSSYERIADFGGITLDVLIEKIHSRKIAAWFQELINDGKGTSLFDLARKMEISDGLIRTLSQDSGKLDSIHSYVMLSEITGVKLDNLRPSKSSTRLKS